MMTNKNSRRAILSVLWIGMVLSIFLWFGCEDKNGLSHKPETEGMAFIESSVDLPQTGQWRHGIDFFDMNQDGNLDILAPPPRKTPHPDGKPAPSLWYGNGRGEWSRADIEVPGSLQYAYGDVCGGDFDGDGIADMALAMHAVGVRVIKGKGHGKYENFSKGLSESNFMSRALVADDFDGDGHLEIAAISEMPFSTIFPPPYGVAMISPSPDGWKFRYIAEKTEVKGLAGDQITVGDVNGDGHPDIGVASLVSTKNMVIWINDGKGSFTPFNNGLPQGKAFISVALSDLNRDGKDDLVTCITGFGKETFVGLRAYLTGIDGFTDFSEGLPSDQVFTAVTVCDLDNDGNIELIAGSQVGGIKIYTLKGKQWQELDTDGLPKEGVKTIFGIYGVDVNNDGYGDISVNYAEYGTENGGIKVFLNLTANTK